MDNWWCAVGNEPMGPITNDQLRLLLSQNQVGRQTLVWRQGMESWKELQEVGELASALLVPPPIPQAQSNGDPSEPLLEGTANSIAQDHIRLLGLDPRRTHFRRFYARLIDLHIAGFMLGVVLVLPLSLLVPEFGSWLDNSREANALFFCLMLLAPLTETVMSQLFGRTVGKAIFDVRVTDKLGGNLNWRALLGRNYRAYWFGLAAALPLMSLITMAYQSRVLKKFGITAYDIDRYTVKVMPISRRRYSFGVAIFVLLTVMNMYFLISDGVARS